MLTLSQFERAFIDKPNDELLSLVNAHHFLTTILSFGLLGYVAMPRLYQQQSAWRRILLIAGITLLYYGLICLNTYALLIYLHSHFEPLPTYLERRVTVFMNAKWYDYLIDPVVLFFIFGQSISYLLTPLLIKAVRDAYTRSKAQLTIEKERRRLEIDNLELEKENTTKDLQFLRQQINPHFLLNAFNNIYALIHRKDNRAADTLANLSTLMRYTLYRTGQEFVPFNDELLFIGGYIDMERIRHSEPEAVTCRLPEPTEEYRNWLIPPLLLVTFIENAFKHGLNAVYEGGWVCVDLTAELVNGGSITLTVTNNKAEFPEPTSPDSGIGLVNVKRRLALLYPEQKFELTITDQPDQFFVRLSIPLQRKEESIQPHEHPHKMFTN